MARAFQALRLKRKKLKNKNAKYTIVYKKITRVKNVNQNRIISKYVYTTYDKMIVPKQSLSYSKG